MTTTETSTGPTEGGARLQAEDVVAHGVAIRRPSECLPRMLGWCPNPRSPQTCGGHPSHGMPRLPWYVTGDRPRNRQHLRRGHRPRRP